MFTPSRREPQIAAGLLRKKLAQGAGGSLAIKFLYVTLTFSLSTVLARVLGPTGLGQYSFAVALSSFLAIPALLGFKLLVVREVSSGLAKGRWGYLAGVLRRSRQLTFVVSVVLACLAAVLAISFRGHMDEQGAIVILAALPLIGLIAQLDLNEAFLRGLGRVLIGQLARWLLLPVLLLTLIGVTIGTTGNVTPLAAVTCHVFAGVGALVAAIYANNRLRPKALAQATPQYETKRWLTSAWPMLVASSMQSLNRQGPLLMLGLLGTAEGVGYYHIASRGADLVVFGLQAVNLAIAPTVARLYTESRTGDLQRLITWAARATLCFALIGALVLIFGGRWIVSFLFGREFLLASLPLAILAGAQVFNAAMGSVGVILNMTGHERDAAAGVMLATIINVVLSVLLIPIYGAIGAAVAASIALILWNLFLTIRLYQKTGFLCTALSWQKRNR